MKRPDFSGLLRRNCKGQATTELAIAGAIVIMALAYLVQYGYIYNCRQALEMYTFRKALQLSREKERGISLTVIRDVILPSFFTGISRQRLMASANVDYNPYKIYIPYEEDPEDVPTLQLLQINDGMIRNGYLFQIPPTLIRVDSTDNDDPHAQWGTSSVAEMDSQAQLEQKSSTFNYVTTTSENRYSRNINKNLTSHDIIPTKIIFDKEGTIRDTYWADNWEGKITNVRVYGNTIPGDVNMIVDETVTKTKDVNTRK